MKITQLELTLTHSSKRKTSSEVELFSIFYFKNVGSGIFPGYIYQVETNFCQLKL